MKTHAEMELEEWKKRVFFDVRFKEDTAADLKKLKKIQHKFLEKFTIVSSPTEVSVYKIGRFFVENGMSNQQITFVDGRLVETYISVKDPHDWSKRKLIDQFMDMHKSEIRNKVVFIPVMHHQWDQLTALYFVTQLRYHHAAGLVFYSDGPNNLAEVLVQGSDIQVYEFPKVVYGDEEPPEILDDEW